jgi:outer membrane protein TolC
MTSRGFNSSNLSVSSVVRKYVAVGLCWTLYCAWPISFGWAQQSSIQPVRPAAAVLWRPYLAPAVPPIRLANSGRLRDLIRAGTLYLSAQDAIALALENNIDIEVARYDPIISAWQVERAEAGGALPGVPSGASQAGSVASGQGVAGSQAAAGVSINGGTVGGNAGNATVSQIGPITQNLDPSFQDTTAFSHRTVPEPNNVLSITPVLVSDSRVYNASLQEGFLSGGSVSLSYNNHYLNENSPSDLLNPSVAPNLSVSYQHNLLRGFGAAVNGRTITVAKINLATSDLNFKSEVINIVANVLNTYYAFVADYDDVKAKKSAVAVAQTFYEESKRRVELGALAELDVVSAESLVAASQQDLVIAQASFQQDELQLKNLLSRTGTADPLIASAQIVPLDRIVIPDRDDVPPLEELVQKALANRSDIAADKARVTTAAVSALGTLNGVLPSWQVFGGQSQTGLAGVPRFLVTRTGVQTADPYFVGGMTDALGQVFRRNFPSERAGTFFQAQIGNRQAQADAGIDQLQLRQTQLTTQKSLNQVQVDVLNSVIALQQARARYDAAVQNRILQRKLFESEQEKFTFGASIPYNVVQQQRDLMAALFAETSALVTYSNARIALDQAVGTTLESNHISIGEARAGKVARPSSLPAHEN